MSEPATPPPRRWRLLLGLFFLSGISGLIYESIWSRYIRLFVGSAATAQILVLSLFMGGMSVGALLAGRWVSRIRTPILAYGLAEGLLGLYALAFPYLEGAVTGWCYDALFPALAGGVAVGLAKWTVAGLLIVPPCLLLGTTFPLMSVGILRRARERSGEILSLLYFTNSLGASVGAVLSGFVLVARVGLPGALMVAAAINLVIMLAAGRDRQVTPPIREHRAPTDRRVPLAALFGVIAFGTGLSSFMYEVGWIRLLSMILGSATHSFEVMLSAFVLGLALGGLWVRRRMDRFRRPELVLAIVQLAMGIAAIATLPAYIWAVDAISWLLTGNDVRTESLWMQFNVLRYALCLLVMLPATFCAGMTLPLLTHVLLRRGHAERVVGRIYGLNTLGAIVGAVAAGLILMPLVQLEGVLVIGALVDMLLGLYLLRWHARSKDPAPGVQRLVTTAAGSIVLMLGFALTYPLDPMVLASSVFRRGRKRLYNTYRMLSHVDGRTATVSVVEDTGRPSYHIIFTNGKPDASLVLERWPQGRDPSLGPDLAGDEPNQFLVGLVPLMVRPDAERAALIGFGSGVTCHTMLGSPNLRRLDTIEIEPEMVEGSKFFRPVNWRAYDDERNHIHFDDAKAFFAAAGRKYDVIVSEPTNPWVSGVSSLFTVEFYRQTKRYLAEGGVLAQWIQGYELSDELLFSVLAAIDQEFDDYLIVRIGERDWVIVSSPKGPVGGISSDALRWPDLVDTFALLGIHDIGQVDALMMGNKQLLHPFLADWTPNRDVMPVLDTGAEEARFMRAGAEALLDLRWTPAPIMEVLGGYHSRPYPPEGIGDLRDAHVLRESEQAALQLRVWRDPDEAMHPNLSAASMMVWETQNNRVELGAADWELWLAATYGVYQEVAPFMKVHEKPWWMEARLVAEDHDAPMQVVAALNLLDALSRRDGERLLEIVEPMLADSHRALPEDFVAVAGVVALQLVGADTDRRRTYVEEHLAGLGRGTVDDTGTWVVNSDDYAFRMIRAYAGR